MNKINCNYIVKVLFLMATSIIFKVMAVEDADKLDLLPDKAIAPIQLLATEPFEAEDLMASSSTQPEEFQLPFKVIEPEFINRYKSLYKNRATGSEYDPSTGTVTFAVTDVSIPGNSSLPVELRRWIPADDLRAGGFGKLAWHWDIPMIKANYMAKNPLVSNGEIINTNNDGWRSGKNCTTGHSTQLHVSNRENSYGLQAVVYWSGKQLHIPGKTTEKFLEQTQQDGTIKQVTKSNYYVSNCIDIGSGQEGFIVKGPDGSSYTFSQVAAYFTGDRTYNISSPATTATKLILVSKIEDKFGNTVEYKYDHQGNLEHIIGSDGRHINITYTSYEYKNIIYYIADTVSANSKTWSYRYTEYAPDNLSTETRKLLTQVVLPDNTTWNYDESLLKLAFNGVNQFKRRNIVGVTADSGDTPALCEAIASDNINNHTRPFSTTVTSPDGLSSVYSFETRYHGRSKVNTQTFSEMRTSSPVGGLAKIYYLYNARNLNCNVNFSLVNKIITGHSLTPQVWTYEYSENLGTYIEGIDQYGFDYNSFLTGTFTIDPINSLPSNVLDRENFRTTTVTGPDSKMVYYIDRLFQSPTEGKILAEDSLNLSNNNLLKRTEYSFNQDFYVGEFWFVQSTDFDAPTRLSLNGNSIQHRINKAKIRTKIYNEGGADEYTIDYADYDDFGFNRETIESNDLENGVLTNKRFTKQEYLHDEVNWLLGLPTKNYISASAEYPTTPMSEVIYHDATTNEIYANWKLPYQYKSFGTWLRRYPEYYMSGTAKGRLKTIEYNQKLTNSSGVESANKYRYQKFESYYRGMAQRVIVPGRYSDLAEGELSFSRIINDDGWVMSITDLNGRSVDYDYDNIGRLASIDMNSELWLDTSIVWEQYEGSPIRRIAKSCDLSADKSECISGSLRKSVVSDFDALYRVLDEYQTDGSINRYQNFTFDSLNNPTFTSLVSSSIDENRGVINQYDNIGRITSTYLPGGGTVMTRYLKGNKVEVTDAENNITTTTYQAFGMPTQRQPIFIDSPELVSTTIKIDIYGNINEITQKGFHDQAEVSQTEYRAYDSQNYLCQITRDDVGTSVYGNNLLGEVVWKAKGQKAANETTCNEKPTTDYVDITYDNLGGQRSLNYRDSNKTTYFTLDNVGNIKDIVSDDFSYSYNYNLLDLVVDETLIIDGKTFSLSYGYDNLGGLISTTYPDGLPEVNYSPNSFGQATQAIRYYSDGTQPDVFVEEGASYYANGSINSFIYGNGVIHKTYLDNRDIPRKIHDSHHGKDIINLSYEYDFNNNITKLTNTKAGGIYSLSLLTYDGLGRLTSTIGGYGIGSTEITYDGLGNIRTYSNNSRFDAHNLTYSYNNNRLSSVTGAGSHGYDFNQAGVPGADAIDSYDTRGNVIHNGKRSFEYNLANQMIKSGSSSFVYDGFNRRVKSVKDDGKIEYSMYSQLGQLLYRETDQGGINYIFLGKRLVAKEGTGVVSSRDDIMNYKPFGDSIEEPRDDVGFTGHKFDSDLGLIYMQARYYDPVIGRFYSNDPVDVVGHMQRRNSPAHGFNRYAYANNNPYKYTDPDGKFAFLAPLVPPAVVALGKALGFVGTAAVAGYAGSEAINALNESAEPAAPDVESGKELDPADKGGELTKAGRAGQKHGSRSGSAFPPATGDANSKNNQGQGILEGIVNNPDSTSEGNQRGGTDVTAPDGKGARFNEEGKFTGFLEPKRDGQ